ncbi:medium-chain acyl-CoA ligase ACSF2, mitochondrial isoform X1 [Octopus bimaculoides]|uniref:medium-chain acyl-CoA ligase ACSF2, mitochondrial isoform X1 n=1 Tax=Octopus bimaculoides TaxID=37653 RepID=UPI00071D7058|nr:medium-chain acyl-CoA ligase ACSF2, mitochondrial isoform X1 [Octopus bimaculoides]XP_052826227.1 medium-chain acyl-CoA ligase ACSF2, mitochondrial isoform X1 [Octopus bimaculoides]|eukprot:XP_014777836.1 PREDICTED: acyl-CoA synthetase family member 2, mitochondrial-like isoform X1 [Octopus bimaculoides]
MSSYLHTKENSQISYETIPERLRKRAEEYPGRVTIVCYDAEFQRHQITMKEMYDGAVKFAKALMKLGVEKGDTIAFCVPNCVEWMSYDIGIMMTGAYSMRLIFGLADIKSIIKGCSAVVFGSKSIWDSFLSIAQINDDGKVSSEACPDLRFAINVSNTHGPANALSAAKLIAEISDDDAVEFPYIDSEDIASINQTSGSTGVPKRICHSHFDCLNNKDSDFKDTSLIIFSSRPMGYSGGYPMTVLTRRSLHVSGDVEMLNDPKNLNFVIDIWQREKCNMVGVAPQDLKRLSDCDFRVNMIMSGGDMITRDTIEDALKVADCFLICYGSTECFFMTNRIFTLKNISEHRQGMLGRPVEGTEIKIVDEEKRVVDIGKTGYLYFRSKWVTKTHLDGTSCLENGWYPTSDICYLTEDGDLIMVGRSTDFIKKSTVKLSIKLIEEYVGRHPSVDAVVVVPIPDEAVGERVCVCVTLRLNHKFNEEELKKFCTETMPHPDNFGCVSMHPDYILCFPSFPHLASGKLDKKTITSLAMKKITKM